MPLPEIMSNTNVFTRRFRPHLFIGFRRSQCPSIARRFSSLPSLCIEGKRSESTHDYEKRVAQLETYIPLSQCYPRLSEIPRPGLGELKTDSAPDLSLNPGETDTNSDVVFKGRVRSVRTAGSKLIFFDLARTVSGTIKDSGSIQIVCQFKQLQKENSELSLDDFKSFGKMIRKGDFYMVRGHNHCTERGEASILATELPTMMSPSLHQVPDKLEDPEARARSRHVDMLVNDDARVTLEIRSLIEHKFIDFFSHEGYTKVTTPILSSLAGGAAARPFQTEATELAGEKLSLRIAPELWLKRLVVGGMERVYEIGPAFRNEGVDATHNPEFTICEFYRAWASLDDLIATTWFLITLTEQAVRSYRERDPRITVEAPWGAEYFKHYDEVQFIPELEKHLRGPLPNLQHPDAQGIVLSLFDKNEIPQPANPTLPRLLDALAAHYIEPLSHKQPLFITHHPACMSPLSKHFLCTDTKQIVAARAELFIQGREYANMYEEENSPFEQRRKFEEQAKMREQDSEAMQLDESYLQALEWALPPTGGWGCGVDRFVMLFAGRERMADVLAFGSLRNVVGLGQVGKRKA
ncbi:lysyl-trna synthetase like protein [Zymoseptoria brevis]|uniref:Lysyl-tRNA synthetase n=1 Tax=Zymoseptoria brevis TaxID=1047168 RepID=A0A0F4H1V8_9PEZI|nr:lysyl-trna synthetase like protein [Zymoseptoria brevis]